ncbi:porphobilinogen deaminase [Suhomyces tanzawaensis NRRL Y-17324]|uniref:Porphobilinogen deaminase n=1 Tax=Suhomyces tanzawaensis NRRL Y-17324 TaxID=984487 RepID=A0A1E4SSP8_9ASCO|nr:porphobilinogen deaminase [Suhomyces tanzawaensis NRRL Y-17324]ODV82447.1 porphobilinogen deaminase [Suhomyces tanzawaensis NRRL Y-17324]
MPHDDTLDIPNNHIQIGGRKSVLAVYQSEKIKALILDKFPQLKCSILALSTLGDKVQTKPLYSFGGKALWTKELEILLLEAVEQYPKLDLIVHALKDMPTNLPDEFELGCITNRIDPRDAVVMKAGSTITKLSELPEGSLVGTSSIRRSSQLLRSYPHLRFDSVRGNLQTRLRKLDAPDSPFSCLILAAAGLDRIDMGHRITQRLDAPEMYYAVGQGALGIEIRKGDKVMKKILERIEDIPASLRCHAERSLMRYLEGGCSVPIGVGTSYDEATQVLNFKAIIVSPDGTNSVEDEVEGVVKTKEEADALGIKLADLLIAKGAKEILDSIDFTRINEPPTSTNNTPNDTPLATPTTTPNAAFLS